MCVLRSQSIFGTWLNLRNRRLYVAYNGSCIYCACVCVVWETRSLVSCPPLHAAKTKPNCRSHSGMHVPYHPYRTNTTRRFIIPFMLSVCARSVLVGVCVCTLRYICWRFRVLSQSRQQRSCSDSYRR